jgi:hypothetical protein
MRRLDNCLHQWAEFFRQCEIQSHNCVARIVFQFLDDKALSSRFPTTFMTLAHHVPADLMIWLIQGCLLHSREEFTQRLYLTYLAHLVTELILGNHHGSVSPLCSVIMASIARLPIPTFV